MTSFASWYSIRAQEAAADARSAMPKAPPLDVRNNLSDRVQLVYEAVKENHGKAKCVQAVARTIKERLPEPVYQRLSEIDKITPYDLGSLPNYPAVSNLLYFIQDTREAMQACNEATKNCDHEEIDDSVVRLAGTFANLAGSVGMLYEWAEALPPISSQLPGCITGIATYACFPLATALCVVEGVGDAYNLFRQKEFRASYDLELLSDLRTLIEHPEATDNMEIVEKLIQRFSERDLAKQFPKGAAEFKQLQDDLQKHSFYQRHVVETHAPKIEAIAHRILNDNLCHMQSEYLSLSKDEVKMIEAKIKVRHNELKGQALQEKVEEAYRIELEKKKKKLSRRIMPWIVKEAEGTVPKLLTELNNESEVVRKKCLRAGLSFMHDINIQSQKKRCVHILGLIALGFAALGFLALIIPCPHVVILALAIIATTLAVIRFAVYKGLLNVRGWNFSPKEAFYETLETVKLKWDEFWDFKKANEATREIPMILHPALGRA